MANYFILPTTLPDLLIAHSRNEWRLNSWKWSASSVTLAALSLDSLVHLTASACCTINTSISLMGLWNCCLCWTAELVLAGQLGYLKLAHVSIVALIQACSETIWALSGLKSLHTYKRFPLCPCSQTHSVGKQVLLVFFISLRSLLATILVQLVSRAWAVLEKHYKLPLKLNI